MPHRHEGTIPLAHPVKQKIRDALVALSLSNLCFLKASFDVLSDAGRYFDKLPVTTPMLLALLTTILGFALLAWLVMQVLRRFQGYWLHLPINLLFFILMVYPLDFIRIKCTSISDYQIAAFVKQPVIIVCGTALFALFVWKHRLIAKIVAATIGILSPLAAFIIIKILLTSLGFTHFITCTNEPAPPPLLPVHEGQPRVVWIIFDAMDYRLAFEERPANVQLPEFDRLKKQALFSTSAYSPNDITILSMPALITGRQTAAASAVNTCDLSITFNDNGYTAYWKSMPSVFSEARASGFNTALVGWYLPYGRELGPVLNFCQWYSFPLFEPCHAKTFGGEISLLFASLSETVHLRNLYIKIHREGLQTSLSLVTNSTYGLTLLHLAAPHKPGVYLPDQNKFIAWTIMPKVTGYFNNLVLADRQLGQIRRSMESSGLWDKTWIILSADHSWAESNLYDHKHDTRVPFIIKAARANEPIVYSRPFNTVLTHDLILSILRGENTNQQNLPAWLDKRGQPLPTFCGKADI